MKNIKKKSNFLDEYDYKIKKILLFVFLSLFCYIFLVNCGLIPYFPIVRAQYDVCGDGVKTVGEECDYSAPNPDDPCQHYEYCDLTCSCYDFRPDMAGCNYYDYCTNGHDPDNPTIPCSSNWDIYCYTADSIQVDRVRNICIDTAFTDHWWRTCPRP